MFKIMIYFEKKTHPHIQKKNTKKLETSLKLAIVIFINTGVKVLCSAILSMKKFYNLGASCIDFKAFLHTSL